LATELLPLVDSGREFLHGRRRRVILGD
jgi:hypothetical protein